MSLDKAIENGKEKRKQYKYKNNFAKSVDYTCRNHGSCEWCRDNRLHSSNKRIEKSIEDLKEYKSK